MCIFRVLEALCKGLAGLYKGFRDITYNCFIKDFYKGSMKGCLKDP